VLPGGRLIGIDRDPAALPPASEALAGLPVTLVEGNFRHLGQLVREHGCEKVHGILLDLGLSSDQLADAERGFSFQAAGSLDMRYNPQEGEPAWQRLEKVSERELADVLHRLGEERYSRRLARAIVRRRSVAPLRRSDELAELVRRVVPRERRARRFDPATRTFQALRIWVNDELGALEAALEQAAELLVPQGRLAVISFHSLEDRLVKERFRSDSRWQVLTRKPIFATPAEVASNPRARSARLRVAARTGIG
jgi:16S rRNA (cytosine1402-N4)-methyltransferase